MQAVLLAVIPVALLLLWNILGTLYWLPVWLAGYLAGRELGGRAAWRLSGASLLPCGLLLALGIFLFDFGVLDLVQISLVIAAHLFLGWIYLFVSLLFLPRRGSGKKSQKNPFLRN